MNIMAKMDVARNELENHVENLQQMLELDEYAMIHVLNGVVATVGRKAITRAAYGEIEPVENGVKEVNAKRHKKVATIKNGKVVDVKETVEDIGDSEDGSSNTKG